MISHFILTSKLQEEKEKLISKQWSDLDIDWKSIVVSKGSAKKNRFQISLKLYVDTFECLSSWIRLQKQFVNGTQHTIIQITKLRNH